MCGWRRYPDEVTHFILGLQPASLGGDAERLGAVPRPGLLDARGEVIPYRSLGKVELGGDLGDGPAVRRGLQHVALARGERVDPVGERGGGQVRVDDPLA